MSDFTTPLELTPAPELGRGMWRTTRVLLFYMGSAERARWQAVPAGFATDLGTIPAPVSLVLRPDDPRFAAAFVLHDYLCREEGFPRLVADAVFRHALRVLARKHGAARWRPEAMYWGVRAWAAGRWLGRALRRLGRSVGR